MRKFISVIAACIGAPLLAAGIALPSASADPTDAPGPNPTVSNQPPRGSDGNDDVDEVDTWAIFGPRS